MTDSLLHLLSDLVPQLVLVELRLPVLPVEDAGHGALDAAPQVLVRGLRKVAMRSVLSKPSQRTTRGLPQYFTVKCHFIWESLYVT